MNTRFQKAGAVVTLLGVMLWFFAGICIMTSYAEDKNDGSLSLNCVSEDKVLAGMQWNLYKVGYRYGDKYQLSGDFEEYPVSLEDTTSTGLSDIASTLENCVIIDKISPLMSGETDSSGKLDFTDLEQGLYLVCGNLLKIDTTSYVPEPFILEIGEEEDGTNQNYTINPKFFHFGVLDQMDADYTIKKIWRNDANQLQDRTVSISVEMYKDGEYFETVVLDESNDWSYTWTDQAHTDWRVKEVDIPENYTVVYRSNETQYAIVNTHKFDIGDQPPEETTSTTTTTSITTSTTTVTGTGTFTATETTITTDEVVTTVPEPTPEKPQTTTTIRGKLPQTGQLWWPVPVLAGGGIILISIGLRIRSRK